MRLALETALLRKRITARCGTLYLSSSNYDRHPSNTRKFPVVYKDDLTHSSEAKAVYKGKP
jgi:hypothetical protein